MTNRTHHLDRLLVMPRFLTILTMFGALWLAPGFDRKAMCQVGAPQAPTTFTPPAASEASSLQPLQAHTQPNTASASAVSYESTASGGGFQPWETFVGYDGGIVIANHGDMEVPEADYPFLMRINSWFHLRHANFQSDGPNGDQNTFSFERLRLSFGGHAYSPDLKYFTQLDGNSDRTTDAVFLDYFISYDIGHAIYDCKPGRLGLRFGKWKMPFSRSREESGKHLLFADRSSSNIFFDLNRSVGVSLYGKLEPWGQTIHYETAFFNGVRTGSFATNRTGGLDQNIAWSARAFTDVFNPFGNDGEADLGWREAPALRLGSGMAMSRVDMEGATEFGRALVVDSGATLASILPVGVDAYDFTMYTMDAHFKYRGMSVIAEYYWRTLSNFRGGAIPTLNDDGFNLQSGYFVFPESFELIARWARITGDSGTLGAERQSSDEVGGGFVMYFNGHNAKLTFDVSHFNGVPVNSSRMDVRPGDIGWLMRTQFQLAF